MIIEKLSGEKKFRKRSNMELQLSEGHQGKLIQEWELKISGLESMHQEHTD